VVDVDGGAGDGSFVQRLAQIFVDDEAAAAVLISTALGFMAARLRRLIRAARRVVERGVQGDDVGLVKPFSKPRSGGRVRGGVLR